MNDIFSTIEAQAAKYNAAVIKCPICFGCQRYHEEIFFPAIVGIEVIAGGKTYPAVCIDLCGSCAVLEDYNRIKRNLSYFMMECPAVKLNDA